MFKFLLLSSLVFFSSPEAFTQTAYTQLNSNNTSATINAGAVFFNNTGTQSAGYEYPSQSGNHLIYANSFWFGGKDSNGQVKLSGQKYTWGQDMFTGPLTTTGAAEITPSVVAQYDMIWKVSKSDIDDHIANYTSSSYVVPSVIQDWPAHGDVNQDQDYYLAPFIDANSNGVYDPENGDYPLIRGDLATYMILNDNADVHSESGADPIGIECHFMFYQYNTSDDLNNTTFVNIKLINRGTQTLYDFAVGSFLDADIGDANDDYMGCDSSLNLLYAYNGSASDNVYGIDPPAVGLLSLNHNLGTAGVFSNFSGPADVPSTPVEYHLNMTGYFNDGSPRTLGGTGYGGTVPNKFQYHGNPNNPGEWSEVDENNISGERRMMCATETITLTPNDEICYDFAVVVGDGGNNLENVNNLMTASSFVQSFFDSQDFICENYEATLHTKKEAETLNPSVYPVPSQGVLNIELSGTYDLKIYSVDGRLVTKRTKLNDNEQLQLALESGVYVLELTQNDQVYTQRIVME